MYIISLQDSKDLDDQGFLVQRSARREGQFCLFEPDADGPE